MKKRIATEQGYWTCSDKGDIRIEEDYIKVTPTGKHYQIKARNVEINRMSNSGYYSVRINGKDHYIHRLVATLFVKNPDTKNKIYVNHIDGDKLNNNYKNLEWVTPSENMQHASKMGLIKQSKKRNAQVVTNSKEHSWKTQKYTFVKYDLTGKIVEILPPAKENSIKRREAVLDRFTGKGYLWRVGEHLIKSYGEIPEQLNMRGCLVDLKNHKKVYRKIDKDGNIIFEATKIKELPISSSRIIQDFNNEIIYEDGSYWFIDLV